ncbi:MAG TPA: 2-C-methyl-D-erythritol 4-phosphate cytidylyltransferase [Verrucomicrobiota bacterium]|nr:2-C-methyl-D-erythritol 4-phosphate cytidylyltransferase [Verrucomicrobiota bacterium]HNU49912.1 2-C-methyl-D-erythritol 4-phosphate cytidylyltransferase [Verrucomicrobiota bacterium]
MNSAVIVAAGHGRRMGPGPDKLLLPVAGRPVIAHTWERFNNASCVDEVILVTRPDLRTELEQLAARLAFAKPWKVVDGGSERQDSVWNGLEAVDSRCAWVLIQDGARPCVREELLIATLEAARSLGAAVAARRVTDTIKESADGVSIQRHLDRSRLWSVQTPQTFRIDVIRRALAAVRERGTQVTDDTAACDLIGQPVALVESRFPNPKITVAEDLPVVEHWLAATC